MEPLLIDKHALGEILSMGPRSARALCEQNGVMPINVGKGNRTSLRGRRDDGMQMVSTLQATGKKEEIVPRKKSSHVIMGKSEDKLFQEISNKLQ